MYFTSIKKIITGELGKMHGVVFPKKLTKIKLQLNCKLTKNIMCSEKKLLMCDCMLNLSYSRQRGQRVEASWGCPIQGPLKPLIYHGTVLPSGLRG